MFFRFVFIALCAYVFSVAFFNLNADAVSITTAMASKISDTENQGRESDKNKSDKDTFIKSEPQKTYEKESKRIHSESSVTGNVDPVSHHATYKIAFSCDPSAGFDYSKASGTMTLELVRYEQNWIIKQTSSLRMNASNGNDDESETTSTILSSTESSDGQNYRFTAQAMREGAIEEEIVGSGRFAGEDGAGTVVYSPPESMTISLPEKTVFPLKHLRLLMEKARSITSKSVQLLECKVFDGSSDVRDALRIDAVIAPVDPKSKTIELTDPSLVGPHKLYRAEMSVFTLSNTSHNPDYKVIQVFSDQGIIFEIIVDYGDYKIISKLTDLKIFTEDTAQAALKMSNAMAQTAPTA